MKKIMVIFTAVLLVMLSTIPAFAGSMEDWQVMPGNLVGQQGEPVPYETKITGDGLQVTYSDGEYTPGGPNAGVMLKAPVTVDGFSVKFTINKAAGDFNEQNTGIDSWISLCLLHNNEKYFDVSKPNDSMGIVTLIRPTRPTTRFEVYQLIDNWGTAARGAMDVKSAPEATFTVEVKKLPAGIYGYYVNGEKLELINDFETRLESAFKDGNAYLYMGMSCHTPGEKIQFTIHEVNGKVVGEDSGASENADQGTGTVDQDQTTSEEMVTESTGRDTGTTEANTTTNAAADTSEDNNTNDASVSGEKNGTNVLYIIVPIGVVIVGALILFAVKKSKGK